MESDNRSPSQDLAIIESLTAPIEIEQLRENLYLLRGGGRMVEIGGRTVPSAGTTAVFVTERGVVLVDTKLPGCGAVIAEKVREITDKPVTTIVNTHAHMDHVCGNVEFPDSVEIVAQEETAHLMREMRPVSGGPAQPNLFEEHRGRGLPTRTFRDRLTIGSGDERVELFYFGRAHTSGDAWVLFPALSVVHAGDVFGYKAIPLLDVQNGASGAGYPGVLAKAIETFHGIETVVTGHYPETLTFDDLKAHGDFTALFVNAVRSAKRAGQTIADFCAAWTIPARFEDAGYVGFAPLRRLESDVEAIWNEAKEPAG